MQAPNQLIHPAPSNCILMSKPSARHQPIYDRTVSLSTVNPLLYTFLSQWCSLMIDPIVSAVVIALERRFWRRRRSRILHNPIPDPLRQSLKTHHILMISLRGLALGFQGCYARCHLIQRDQRWVAPADCWNWRKWGLMEYNERGPSFVGLLGSSILSSILPWLLSVSPVKNSFFLTAHFFNLCVPIAHQPAVVKGHLPLNMSLWFDTPIKAEARNLQVTRAFFSTALAATIFADSLVFFRALSWRRLSVGQESNLPKRLLARC